MAPVIASGLTKSYDGIRALDAVGLRVEEGEIHGLLGPNGAGKTTLLRVLLGLIAPDEGTVELFGRAGPAGLEGIAGFVEEPSFYPYLSARANLEVLAELDGAGARERIGGSLALAGLADRAEDRVGGYSSGMRQRLGIAAALMREPRLLLLDEPTTGLDPEGAREVGALLRRLAGEGVAVLLSSHQIGELESLCDCFSVLRAGRIVWAGTAAEMRAQAGGSSYRLLTSDDRRARELAGGCPGVLAEPLAGGGLSVTAEEGTLDGYVLALAGEGIAVRHLARSMNPLESTYFALTGSGAGDPGR